MSVRVRDAVGLEMLFVSHSPLIAASDPASVNREIEQKWRFYVGGFPRMPDVKAMERGGADELELQRLLRDCVAHAHTDGFDLVVPGPASAVYLGRSPNADRYVKGFISRLDEEIRRYTPEDLPANRRAN